MLNQRQLSTPARWQRRDCGTALQWRPSASFLGMWQPSTCGRHIETSCCPSPFAGFTPLVGEGRAESSPCLPLSARATPPGCRSYGTNHSTHIETSLVKIKALPVSQCRTGKRGYGTSQDHPNEGIANAIVSARREVNAEVACVRSMAVLVRKTTVSFATQVNMLLTMLLRVQTRVRRPQWLLWREAIARSDSGLHCAHRHDHVSSL